MSEQNLIENKINNVLNGDAQKNALNFIAFLNDNKLSLDSNGDNQGWAIGGTVENSNAFILVNGDSDMPGPWTIWFNSSNFGNNDCTDDDVKKIAWQHVNTCAQCHEGWKDCGGGDCTIFGREFENLCHSPLMFTNPDADCLENIKKLLLMVK